MLNSKNDHFERIWINLKIRKCNIVVGIVYFPVDNLTNKADEAQDLQAELIVNVASLQEKFKNVVLMGDFNGKLADLRKNQRSSNGDLLEDIIEVTGLVPLNLSEKCSGQTTWVRGPLSSTIDYALCSEELEQKVNSMLIDEDHEYALGSDHNVILIKATVSAQNNMPVKSQPEVPMQKWNIKDTTNWVQFEVASESCFSDWNSNNFDNANDMWKDFKERIQKAGIESIGYKSFASKKAYWDKEVHQLIKDRRIANRLFRVWSKAPNCSPELLNLLWDDYLQKKKKVSDKIKLNAVKHKTNIITRNASKSTNNSLAYWNMLKKLNKSSNYPLRIRDPDNPDEIIEDSILIKKKLSSYWSKLGKDNTGNVKSNLSEQLDDLATLPPSPDALQSVNFDEKSLKAAIKKLKNNKSTGTDNIPGEFIKYGGCRVFKALLELLSMIKLTESMPNDWYEGIVKPIYKAGNHEDLNNYRGITISSVIYKILVTIIESQVMDFVEHRNLLGEYQGAFRKDRRCEDNIFSLKGICTIRKSKKQKTYLAFMDISKAFDTIDRSKLFIHIWHQGIQDKVWRLIKMLYNKVDNRVIFGPIESDIYQVENGLKQGCVLSPTLFNLVMSDLENKLSDQDGVSIQGTSIQGLYYADDIVLLAANDKGLQDMLHVANDFAESWGMQFNHKKSQVLIIGKRCSDKNWILGNSNIAEVNSYKYLGVTINRQMKDNDHVTKNVASKVKRLKGHISYILAKHMDIKRISFGNTLYHKVVLPSLSHAAGIWFTPSKQCQSQLTSFQYQIGKSILKVKSTPSTTATIGDLGWLPISEHLNIQRISYYNHILNLPDNRLAKLVYTEMVQNFNEDTPGFNYTKFMKDILVNKGMDHMFGDGSSLSVKSFKRVTSASYAEDFTKDIKQLSSLKYYSAVKEDTSMSEYLTSQAPFSAVQLKFKLRTGVSGLGEDIYRQKRGTGFCKTCQTFETVKHFIFCCPAYNKQRQKLFASVKDSVPVEVFNMFLSNHDFALRCLLGEHDDPFNTHGLAYFNEAWKIRQEV